MAAAMNRAAGGIGNIQSSPQSLQPGASSSSGMGGMGLMPQQQQSHIGGGVGNTFGQNQGQGQGQGQQGNLISSSSPVQHQGSNPNMQGQLFSQGMGGGGAGGGGGGGSMGGMGTMDPRMAMGNMSSQQQQRQLLLMQQQQRAANGMGGGGGAGQFNMPPGSMNPMMMNQQQQQQLAFQRQQQQQGQGQGQGPMNSASPTHPGSPMVPDFSGPSGGPPMRSSSAIPGIARRTRSPSDGAPSPLMPRGMPTRVGSLGQEEYQRMMLQQQHGQAVRAMSSQSPTFNQHQQMMAGAGGGGSSSNWSQQGGSSNYGMSPADNTSGFGTGGGIPSPTNNGQSWNTATQGGYPFAPSPASDHVRNMSATPAPQQQNQGLTRDSPSADQNLTSEFDLFNWNA
jgi:hypothetical protein